MALRWRRLLPGLWAGVLLCIALIATPAIFAVLPPAEAGKVVSRIFVHEAWLSLALAGALLLLDRQAGRGRFATQTTQPQRLMLWGTVACTLIGYFAVLALMPAARAGQGVLSFAQLHLVSTVFYGLKTLLVLGLAWRSGSA